LHIFSFLETVDPSTARSTSNQHLCCWNGWFGIISRLSNQLLTIADDFLQSGDASVRRRVRDCRVLTVSNSLKTPLYKYIRVSANLCVCAKMYSSLSTSAATIDGWQFHLARTCCLSRAHRQRDSETCYGALPCHRSCM